jgi:hypothetical protein
MTITTRWRRFKAGFLRVQQVALCLIRKWWRPVTLAGVAVATWVNLVAIPIIKREPPNLAEAAAWITACAGLSWVREWGKTKGTGE